MPEGASLSPYDQLVVKTVAGFDPNRTSRKPSVETPDLTPLEVEVLEDGGAKFSVDQPTSPPTLSTLALECRRIVEGALTEQEVAVRLETSDAEVKRYLRGDPFPLHSFELQGRLLFPAWQFIEKGTIPFLPNLLATASSNTTLMKTPLTFARVMLLPNADLENDDTVLCPREWLIKGNDPGPVLALIRFINVD